MSVIVDNVAQRLGVSRDRAEELVQNFAASVVAGTGDEGTIHVAGLGQFRRSEGTIEFDADARLAAVVNHRFAGLAPVSVQTVTNAGLADESAFAMPDVPIAVQGGLLADRGMVEEEHEHDARPDREVDDADLVVANEADSVDDAGAPASSELEGAFAGAVGAPVLDDFETAPAEDTQSINEPEGSQPAYEMPDDGIVRDSDTEGELSPEWESTAEDATDSQANSEAQGGIETDESEDREIDYSGVTGDAGGAAMDFDSSGNLLVPTRDHGIGDEPADTVATSEEVVTESDDAAIPAVDQVHPHEEPTDERQPVSEVTGASDLSEAGPEQDTDERRAVESAGEDSTPESPPLVNGAPPIVLRRKSRALYYFGLIVVLLIAIAGILYLLSLSENEQSEPLAGDDQVQVSPAENDASAVQDSFAAAQVLAWAPGAIDRRAGGYTLVVSSQKTVDEANAVALEIADDLRDEQLPVDVLRGTARGETWYRVAVGQYSRQSVANRELERLTPRLPEGAWVLRIRTNM